MATCREKIEHFMPARAGKRKKRKRQMNKYIRRQDIEDDDIGYKKGRKPIRGWEF